MATKAAYIDYDEAAAPATPAAGDVRLYAKTDGLLYSKDDAGTETLVSGGTGGGGATELDYAQITSNASITATAAGSADTVVSGASVAYDGNPVWVEFYSAFARPAAGTAGQDITIGLFEGTTAIAYLAYMVLQTTGSSAFVPVYAKFRFTPSAANHTYVIKAFVSGGTGLIGAGAGGAAGAPAFIRITAD